jgi:hypothetical protein
LPPIALPGSELEAFSSLIPHVSPIFAAHRAGAIFLNSDAQRKEIPSVRGDYTGVAPDSPGIQPEMLLLLLPDACPSYFLP